MKKKVQSNHSKKHMARMRAAALISKRKECRGKKWSKASRTEKYRRIFCKQKGSCGTCKKSFWRGKRLVLEMHHIDGNDSNEAENNLKYLCPNCHSLTPGFRGRRLDKNPSYRCSANWWQKSWLLEYRERRGWRNWHTHMV